MLQLQNFSLAFSAQRRGQIRCVGLLVILSDKAHTQITINMETH
jgi:hypothetical protein